MLKSHFRLDKNHLDRLLDLITDQLLVPLLFMTSQKERPLKISLVGWRKQNKMAIQN